MKNIPYKTFIFFIVCSLLFVNACKKDENNNPVSIDFNKLYGLWENEVSVLTLYDSLDNIVLEDTVIHIGGIGEEIDYFEAYSHPSTFTAIADLTDTLQTHEFLIQNNRIIIDVADEIFFSDRTVTVLNDSILSMFNLYSGEYKRKVTQTLKRVNSTPLSR